MSELASAYQAAPKARIVPSLELCFVVISATIALLEDQALVDRP